jgi:hypothetical protein
MNPKVIIALLICLPSLAFAQKSVTVTPANANRNQNLVVSITGTQTNFLSGSNTLTFFYQGSATTMVSASQVTPVTNTTMGASVFVQGSATIGAYTYKLNNFTDGIVNGTGNFIVGNNNIVPEIVSISPGIGHVNQTLSVTVTGTRTQFGQGSPTMQLIQMGSPTAFIQINGYTVVNDSNLLLNLQIDPNANRGMYDFYLLNSAHSLQKTNAFEVTWPIGIEESNIASQVKVYPNPAKEEITIEAKDIVEVQLIDMQGRLVQTESLPEPTHKTTLSIDAAILPKQQYMIKVQQKNAVFYRRILLD